MPEVKYVDGTWRFEYTASETAALKRLRGLWSHDQEKTGDLLDLVTEHLGVLEQHPDLVEAHRLVSMAYLKLGNLQEEGFHLHSAFRSAEKAIDGQTCTFDTNISENWSFLRTVDDLCEYLWVTRNRTGSVEVARRRVGWTEGDLNPMRLDLAMRLLREEPYGPSPTEAVEILIALRAGYPMARYELALARMKDSDWTEAASELRLAVLANPYTAEALLFGPGTSWTLPLMLGKGVQHGRYAANMYATEWRAGWGGRELTFLRWVHSYPLFVMERARVQFFDEQLRWAETASARNKLNQERNDAVAEITKDIRETSSAAVEPRMRLTRRTLDNARQSYVEATATHSDAEAAADKDTTPRQADATREAVKPWDDLRHGAGG